MESNRCQKHTSKAIACGMVLLGVASCTSISNRPATAPLVAVYLSAPSRQNSANGANLVVERSYDIADLLMRYSDKIKADSYADRATISSSDRAERVDDIKKYLTDNVDYTAWKDNGGDLGEIRFDKSKNAMLVTQTPEAHRKISIALNGLRRPRKQPEASHFSQTQPAAP